MRDAAVGGLLGSTPIICGGFDHREVDQDSCISYNQSQWIKTHTMTTKRYDASIVQLNSTTLWIVGGYNGDYSETKSSEFIGLDSTVGKPGPKFPYPVTGACAVKYSEDKVYVMGGYDGLTSYHPSNKVLTFNPMNGFAHNEAGVPLCKKWNRKLFSDSFSFIWTHGIHQV